MKSTLFLALLYSSSLWASWSVSTYNIRNFDRDQREGQTDLAELQRIVLSMKSDVMAFQEVVNPSAFKKLMQATLPSYEYQISSCGGMGKQNIAIAYDPKLFKFVSKAEDMTLSGGGRQCGSLRPLFLVTLRMKNEEITFGGVHLKAGGSREAFERRWKQYRGLSRIAAQTKQSLVLLGDFNTTGYNLKNEDYAQFEDFIGQAKMRTMSESIGCTNYWEGTVGGPELQSSILDHIVVPDALAETMEDVKVGAHCAQQQCRPATQTALGASYERVSDHCPVRVSFR